MSRSEKVKIIFRQFDGNKDGGLNREETAALVVAVNPRAKFTDAQVNAIVDEVFRSYSNFIDGEKGLTCDGLLYTYDDGVGDVDRDFDTLGLDLEPDTAVAGEEASTCSIDEEHETESEEENAPLLFRWFGKGKRKEGKLKGE